MEGHNGNQPSLQVSTFDDRGGDDLLEEDMQNMEAIEQQYLYEVTGLDEFDEGDDEKLIELEQEMLRDWESVQHRDAHGHGRGVSGKSDQSFVPDGAVPLQNGVLSSKAAEFWFPDARNCPCCHGYKHGCTCIRPGIFQCTDPNCLIVEETSKSATTTTTQLSTLSPAWAPAMPSIVSNMPDAPPVGMRRGYSEPPVSTGRLTNEAKWTESQVCKFFAKGNCNFGTQCRFLHPAGASMAPFSPQPLCVHFQQGHCVHGMNCRYSHGDFNGPPSPPRQSSGRGGGGYVPTGVPSSNGVLASNAGEFWFPESRDCGCCNGFKHGCGCCCEDGVVACRHCQV